MKQKKSTRGGARPGAGRKPKRPTRTLSYRVPADKVQVIDRKIRELIYKVRQSNSKCP
jgi:hypothetical protein